jgi:hypothetical protein
MEVRLDTDVGFRMKKFLMKFFYRFNVKLNKLQDWFVFQGGDQQFNTGFNIFRIQNFNR